MGRKGKGKKSPRGDNNQDANKKSNFDLMDLGSDSDDNEGDKVK